MKKFSDDPGHNVLEPTTFQYRLNSPQVKRNLISSIKNFVYKLSHKLQNNLRLRILENYKILGK